MAKKNAIPAESRRTKRESEIVKKAARLVEAETKKSSGVKVLSFASPESSLIHSADYNPSIEEMTITFAGLRPSCYRYKAIPGALFCQFAASSSKGAFFLKLIKPHFTGELL